MIYLIYSKKNRDFSDPEFITYKVVLIASLPDADVCAAGPCGGADGVTVGLRDGAGGALHPLSPRSPL